MLRTTIFFLFGCSFFFGQTNGIPIVNLKDGTKTTSTSGEGSGSQGSGISTSLQQQELINEINELKVYMNQSNLSMSMSQQDKKFNGYRIYDISGNLKREQVVSATNSYTVDISNLSSGNYLVIVTETLSNTGVSKLFIKPQ
ncbi:MAG: T9SS type A sorting domain-containing protein [Flavobacterium sp.]|nr:MAG: T9SS type A sorting domain-containing protein [Flavobacterium sp.]